MTLQDLLAVKNGSDIRGIASKARANENITLTKDVAKALAKAFCVWLGSRVGKTQVRIALGHDPRISSPLLCEAVANGITSTGHDVVLTGLSTTPSMYKIIKDTEWEGGPVHGAIMITASHLPYQYNGLKFFSPDGGIESADLQDIINLAVSYRFQEGIIGKKTHAPYLDRYAASLVQYVREQTGEMRPLQGKHIVVDAGNGSGGFFANKVLVPLGADTTGSQFLTPDGTFPYHSPNPEDKHAMQAICEAVSNAKADMGIIFDTDVDRAGAVDCDGTEINRNRLIALISAVLLEQKPGTIVTDSVTSEGLTKFIEAKGGKHHRFKRGYKNVINEAIRLNKKGEYTPLAIETSGHAALLENDFLDDGAYVITKLLVAFAKLAKQGKHLTDLIADLETPKDETEIRIRFFEDCDFKTLGVKVIEDLKAYASKLKYATPAKDNHEGCRVYYNKAHGDGWGLVRMSLHEPIIPIHAESNREFGCLRILKDLYYFLQRYPFLDLSPLLMEITEKRSGIIRNLGDSFSKGNLL